MMSAILRVSLAVAILGAMPTLGQQQPKHVSCELAVLDIAAGEAMLAALQEGVPAEDLLEKYPDVQRVLGTFEVPFEEDVTRQRSFPIPGTKLFVTAAAILTDEGMLADTVMLALAVAETRLDNPFDHEEAASSQVVLAGLPYWGRLSKRVQVDGKTLAFSLVCSTMSEEELRSRGWGSSPR